MEYMLDKILAPRNRIDDRKYSISVYPLPTSKLSDIVELSICKKDHVRNWNVRKRTWHIVESHSP